MPRSRPDKAVFLNVPFDADYRPLFEALVFCVIDCDFEPRCALEASDGGHFHVEKITRIISTCAFGVHDISRTELDAKWGLPRFNMPFELGLFLGAKRFWNRLPGLCRRLRLDPDRSASTLIGCWTLNVECWMFPLFPFSPFPPCD